MIVIWRGFFNLYITTGTRTEDGKIQYLRTLICVKVLSEF